MICVPGLCIKCGSPIVEGGAPGPHYEHVVFRIDLGDGGMTDMDVAICHFCEVSELEWDEVIKAHNDYFKINGPMRLNGRIVEQVKRRGRAELQLMAQGGKCLGCHKPIEKNFIMTGGVILHERCNLPEPGPVKARAVDPEKVVVRE